MRSSSVKRLGAAALLSLVLAAGLTSSAVGTYPTDTTAGPNASPTVATTPGPTIAPKVAPTPSATTAPTAPASGSGTSSTPAGCLAPAPSSKRPGPDCSAQAGPSTKTNVPQAVPATATYSISGTVTGTGGTPLTNIEVEADSADYSGYATTVSGGTYSMYVAAGTYKVSFYDTSGTYLNGYYSSSGFTVSAAAATGVIVGTSDVGGINVQMLTGHYISGTVTGSGGAPLANIYVEADSSAYSSSTTTGSGGTYSVYVAAGTYKVYFYDSSGAHLTGYYSSSGFTVNAAAATGVSVGTSDISGINVQMLTGHYISGTVTGTGGTPLANIEVDANSSAYSSSATTGSGGTYSVYVAAGTYKVSFSDPSGTYFSGYYSSGGFTTDQSAATGVGVSTSDVGGINVQMPPGYYMAGTVTGTGGTPLDNIHVEANSSGYYTYTTTASDGTYSAYVPAGTYKIYFYDWTGTYLNGYYSSGGFTTDPSAATGVTVSMSNVNGINVQMQIHARITGTVTDFSGTPLPDIFVQADSSGDSNYTTTASDGTYSVYVAPGTYKVSYSDPTGTYPSGYYSSGGFTTDPSAATGVIVGTSDINGINVQMGTPWSATLATSATNVTAGTPVTLTAQTNHDVGPTPYFLVILASDGTVEDYCGSGTTCTATVSSSTPASQTYTAVVGASNGTVPETTSAPVTVTWMPLAGATYHALPPTRVLDTRNGTGGLSGPFTNHAARTFTVTGASTGVPANATAVTGNLTVTGQTSSGYLFIGPVATNNPGSSTLNFPVGDDRANAVTVALGAGGSLSITFVAPSNGPSANAIFDVTGYFTPDASGATYHALSPTRVLDTRSGTGGLSGPFTNHAARTFTLGGVPAGATAVTGNLTVTGQTSSGYLFIGPVAANNPTSSTLNFPVGDDRANAVTVALGAGGTLSITFVAPSNGPSAQAIFDVTGYFTADMSGALYVPLAPNRVLDTRSGTGGLSGPFTNHAARTFTVSGVPAGAIAVTGNLTVTGQTSGGYLFIGPAASNNPTSSTLNFPVGDDRANAVAVQLGAGTLAITFVGPNNSQSAQAIFDVTGYFAPAGG